MNDIEILEILSRKIEEQNSIIAACSSIINKKAEAKERTEYIEIKKFVENLIKEYKELEEKNKILESLLQGNLFEMYKYYKELWKSYQGNSKNYIPKSKVKEVIQGLNRNIVAVNDNSSKNYKYAKKILEELLKNEEIKERLIDKGL